VNVIRLFFLATRISHLWSVLEFSHSPRLVEPPTSTNHFLDPLCSITHKICESYPSRAFLVRAPALAILVLIGANPFVLFAPTPSFLCPVPLCLTEARLVLKYDGLNEARPCPRSFSLPQLPLSMKKSFCLLPVPGDSDAVVAVAGMCLPFCSAPPQWFFV